MDPAQTLLDCEAHLRAGELVEAAQNLADYWAWRQKGFEPTDGDPSARVLGQRLEELEEGHPDTD